MIYMLDANVLRHVVHEEAGYLNILERMKEVGTGGLSISAVAAAELKTRNRRCARSCFVMPSGVVCRSWVL